VEPFAGSLAALLRRPHAPGIETVNDADGFVANAWRAIAADPGNVSARRGLGLLTGQIKRADLAPPQVEATAAPADAPRLRRPTVRGGGEHAPECRLGAEQREQGRRRLDDPHAAGLAAGRRGQGGGGPRGEAFDRGRLLRDVAASMSDHHVNILSATTHTGPDRVSKMRFEFELADPGHLDSLLATLKGIDSVYEINWDGLSGYNPYKPALGTGTDLNALKADTDEDGIGDLAEIAAGSQAPPDHTIVGPHAEEHRHGLVDGQVRDPRVAEAPRCQRRHRQP
jgi:hypothetical protein